MTAYLFDLDGTLADTLPIILQNSRLALNELGQEATDEQIVSLIGIPLLEAGEVLLGPGQGERYRHIYQKHFATMDMSALAAFPGIPGMLGTLSAGGGKLACVTSKMQGSAQMTLAQVGLLRYFQVLVSAESCTRHKPQAEPALTALRLLDAQGEKAVFIGDSVHDIGCGRNAGILSCGVTWGASGEQQLIAAGATHIARTVEELASVLLAEL